MIHADAPLPPDDSQRIVQEQIHDLELELSGHWWSPVILTRPLAAGVFLLALSRTPQPRAWPEIFLTIVFEACLFPVFLLSASRLIGNALREHLDGVHYPWTHWAGVLVHLWHALAALTGGAILLGHWLG